MTNPSDLASPLLVGVCRIHALLNTYMHAVMYNCSMYCYIHALSCINQQLVCLYLITSNSLSIIAPNDTEGCLQHEIDC